MAVCIESKTATGRGSNSSSFAENTLGILPLVHLKHVLFGNSLVSLPYVDGGGVLADSGEVEDSLLSQAIALARHLGAESIDLRWERAIAAADGRSHGIGMLATR